MHTDTDRYYNQRNLADEERDHEHCAMPYRQDQEQNRQCLSLHRNSPPFMPVSDVLPKPAVIDEPAVAPL